MKTSLTRLIALKFNSNQGRTRNARCFPIVTKYLSRHPGCGKSWCTKGHPRFLNQVIKSLLVYRENDLMVPKNLLFRVRWKTHPIPNQTRLHEAQVLTVFGARVTPHKVNVVRQYCTAKQGVENAAKH